MNSHQPIDGPPLTLEDWQMIARTLRLGAGRFRRSAARWRRDHEPNNAAESENDTRHAKRLAAVLRDHFGDAIGGRRNET